MKAKKLIKIRRKKNLIAVSSQKKREENHFFPRQEQIYIGRKKNKKSGILSLNLCED